MFEEGRRQSQAGKCRHVGGLDQRRRSIWNCWEGTREFPEIWTRVVRESWMRTSLLHGRGPQLAAQLPPPGGIHVKLILSTRQPGQAASAHS